MQHAITLSLQIRTLERRKIFATFEFLTVVMKIQKSSEILSGLDR